MAAPSASRREERSRRSRWPPIGPDGARPNVAAREARGGRAARRRRRPALVMSVRCRAAASHARADRGRGPGGRLSNDPLVQSQVSIAVDPTDDRRVSRRLPESRGRKTRAYSSTDGGSTWTASSDPPLPAGVSQTCAFGDSTVGSTAWAVSTTPSSSASLDLARIGSGVGTPSCSSPTVPTPRHPGRLRHARSPPSSPATRSVPARQTTSPGLPSTLLAPTHPCLRRLDSLRWRRRDQGSAQPRRRRRGHVVRACARERPAARRRGDHRRRGRAARGRYVVWDDIAARTISIARSTDGGLRLAAPGSSRRERSPRSASCDPPGTSIPADPRRCVTAGATVTVDDSSGRYAGGST